LIQFARNALLIDAIRSRGPLLANLLRREVRQRYKGSILGLLWAFIAPVSVMAAYAFVFHYVYRAIDIPDYPLFLLTGMAVWFFFANGIASGAPSLVQNANLVKKVAFPRQFVPLSVVGGHGVTLVAMIVVLIPVNLVLVPASRSPVILLLPVFIVLLALLTFGLALALSAVDVYFRDVEHILGAVLLPWFFLTPILYTPSALPDGVSGLQWATFALDWVNFVSPFVYAIRDVLFFGQLPSFGIWIYCLVASTVALFGGTWAFRRLEGEMAVEL
jgi:lipopolysaccharide transport system permease protein